MNKSNISLTSKQIEEELKREEYKSKYIKIIKSTIFTLIIVVSIVSIITTYLLSILEINGQSMKPTLNEGQIVIAYKDKSLEEGDVIAFYQGNKILIKRVIAKSGSFVNIDEEGNVSVDGKLIDEPYIDNKSLGDSDIEYPYQVPDGHYFVLGDNRDASLDSRSSEIGSVSDEDILGKVVVSVWPLDKMGIIK